jgi:hypothetical protein
MKMNVLSIGNSYSTFFNYQLFIMNMLIKVLIFNLFCK